MSRSRAAVILAAGLGTRMKSSLPKVLHPVGGRAMLDWAIVSAQQLRCERIVVVVGAQSEAVEAHIRRGDDGVRVAKQTEQLGTAHAVRASEQALADFDGDVIVLFGDAPLGRPETFEALLGARAEGQGLAVLGFDAADPAGYGRLILDREGGVDRIVEHRDASPEERAVTLCNSGVLAADRATLFRLLSLVRNDNSKGEFYLTDIVGFARSAGMAVRLVVGDEDEMQGVNTRAQLAEAEAAFQRRARLAAMEAGVTLIDPATVYFSYDTHIEADVLIEPNVVFGPGVSVRAGAIIHAFCHFTEAEIGPKAEVGPFARLRPGAKLGEKVKIGNFVEIKNSTFGAGAKASHLTYVGDADVGARANLGCGVITCNYDGYAKFRTTIGDDAFIGSDTSLVAPVTIGDGAYTGSGSVITKDVPAGALAVARGVQRNIEGWADTFKARKLADKTKD